jgi:hypothetical protein
MELFEFEAKDGCRLADPNDLELNPNNPRIILDEDYQELKESLIRKPQFLYVISILVKDNLVIAGEQRVRILRELGYTSVPYRDLADYTEEEAKELIIKDNQHSGQFDYEKLANGEYFSLQDLATYGLNIKTSYKPVEVSYESKNQEVSVTEIEKNKLMVLSFSLTKENFLYVKARLQEYDEDLSAALLTVLQLTNE